MCLSDKWRNLLFILCAFIVPIDVWSAESVEAPAPVKAIEIRLEPEVRISAAKIVLGDVATIYAKNGQDFNTLSSLVISQFPSEAKEMKLPAIYLRQRIAEALGRNNSFTLHAPSEIKFLQEKIGIDSLEIAEKIISQGKSAGKIPQNIDVEILPVTGFEQLKTVRSTSIKIEPAGEINRWKGEMAFKITYPDSNNSKTIWIRAALKWYADVWMAKRNIRGLEPLGADQFEKSRIEITNQREDLLAATDSEELTKALQSTRAKRYIQERAPLTVAMLDKKPDANFGQKLRVVFISDSGLKVSAEGALMGAASIGDNVKAKLNSSKKIVAGKLVSDGVMEVSL